MGEYHMCVPLFMQVDSAQLYNALYAIPRKSTIPADNTEHKVGSILVKLPLK